MLYVCLERELSFNIPPARHMYTSILVSMTSPSNYQRSKLVPSLEVSYGAWRALSPRLFLFSDERYEGSWLEDQRHGHGTYVYGSGAVYEGEWENGSMHGKGCYTSVGGSRYQGMYR